MCTASGARTNSFFTFTGTYVVADSQNQNPATQNGLVFALVAVALVPLAMRISRAVSLSVFVLYLFEKKMCV